MNVHQKLFVYMLLDCFGILFILDSVLREFIFILHSVLREFILWDQRLSEGLFYEKFWGTKVLLNDIFFV